MKRRTNPIPAKITPEWLSRQKKKRLHYSKANYLSVYYVEAWQEVDIPLAIQNFRQNSEGLTLECGISYGNVLNASRFPHPALVSYTIGTSTFIICHPGTLATRPLAVRYRHRRLKLTTAYDKSRNDPQKWRPILERLIEENPIIHYSPSKPDKRKGAHGSGGGHGPAHPKRGLHGHLKRFVDAKLLPTELLRAT